MKELIVKCLICGKVIKHVTDTMYYDETVYNTQLCFDCHQLTKDLEVLEHFFIFRSIMGPETPYVVELEIFHAQYSDRFKKGSFVLDIIARSDEKCNDTIRPYDLYRVRKDFSSYYMSTELSKEDFVKVLRDNMTEREKLLFTNERFIAFAYEHMNLVIDQYRDCLVNLNKVMEKIDEERIAKRN